MRDYKFRAWDKENSEMLYQDDNLTRKNSAMHCQFIFDDLGDSTLVRLYGEDNYQERTKTELMQFTGLHDKNGKEIYEGDICQDDDGIGVIVWTTDCWSYMFVADDGKYNSDGEMLREFRNYCTVIGNIYENPELLEVQND